MKTFVGYLMTICGLLLLFIGASASDSDLALLPCFMISSLGLLSFIFGALTLNDQL
jgi:hypothetical protein